MALESTWSDPEAELEGSASGDVADLPAAVAVLRDLEDQILATVSASEKTLRSLEAREVHSLAGYEAFGELEERLIAVTRLLGPMRAAVLPERSFRIERAQAPRLVGDDRARRVKALTSIARAVARLRELDAQLRESAEAAVAALDHVDASGSYEQCGYVSYEDFLERAIAPSVALSSALLLVRREPPGPEEPCRSNPSSSPRTSSSFSPSSSRPPRLRLTSRPPPPASPWPLRSRTRGLAGAGATSPCSSRSRPSPPPLACWPVCTPGPSAPGQPLASSERQAADGSANRPTPARRDPRLPRRIWPPRAAARHARGRRGRPGPCWTSPSNPRLPRGPRCPSIS